MKMNTRRHRRENTRRRAQHCTCRPVLSHGNTSTEIAVPLRLARLSIMSTKMPDEAPTTKSRGALGSPSRDDCIACTSSAEEWLVGGGGKRPLRRRSSASRSDALPGRAAEALCAVAATAGAVE